MRRRELDLSQSRPEDSGLVGPTAQFVRSMRVELTPESEDQALESLVEFLLSVWLRKERVRAAAERTS